MLKTVSLGLLLCIALTDAVSFIRWGRTKCPTGTQALYKGFMVGPHYNSGGNGVNFLCAHESPVFVRGTPGYAAGSYAGALWGTEFEKSANFQNLFLNTNLPSGELHNQDMPCVRCYASGDYDVMMIPGRNDCGDSGYNFRYSGFLVGQWNSRDRFRNEYVCLDEAPEGIAGGTGNNDQAVIYPVELACGSLPCSPYVDGMEATCAVCTY